MERMLEATARAEDDHYWFRGLRRHARLLLEGAAHGQQLARIVDCGAGTGRNLDWLDEFGFAVGVELTSVGLAVGRAHRRRMVQGTVTALPFADGTVNLATSFDVLYCLDDASEGAAIGEMWRILKPGGLVLANVAALDVLQGSHSTLTQEVRRYTPSRLRTRLERAGFRLERLTFTNMSLFPPALAVRTIQRMTGRASEASDADLATPAAPVNRLIDVILRAEAAVLSATNLPIGTSIMAIGKKLG